MRIDTAAGASALLTYCANVHPGEGLSDVVDVTRRYIAKVREALCADRLGTGLWLSKRAVEEIESTSSSELKRALDDAGLFAFTLNAFPFGDFHAARVKRRVYHPDWATDERADYTVAAAEILAGLLPQDVSEGTISTLPLGHREETPASRVDACLRGVARAAGALADLRARSGRRIRLCLEPEPGCWMETTVEAIALYHRLLESASRSAGIEPDVVRNHVGLCYDTCHQAVAFENAVESLEAIATNDVPIGKVQLSSALSVELPERDAALLRRFDEPRFLHQVRARATDGTVRGVDDLPLASALPADRPWRVHFHVPIHEELVGRIGTTRPFLEDVLSVLSARAAVPHLEVETYTWAVLPPESRPSDDESLVRGLTAEIEWVKQRLR